MKIALVVGHEELHPGAHAVAPLACFEYAYNKGLAGLISCALMDDKITSEIFFRDQIGILGAYAEVNAYHPDACVELHFNASPIGNVRGTETLYVPRRTNSRRLAESVQASMCLALDRYGSTNRHAREIGVHDRGYTSLTLAECPSILTEPFFGDNPDDAKLGFERKKQIAGAIAQGVANFLRGESALN